jgi:hypothetical protein
VHCKTVCPPAVSKWLALLCASEGCSGGPSRSSPQEDEPWDNLRRLLSELMSPKRAMPLQLLMASVAARFGRQEHAALREAAGFQV